MIKNKKAVITMLASILLINPVNNITKGVSSQTTFENKSLVASYDKGVLKLNEKQDLKNIVIKATYNGVVLTIVKDGINQGEELTLTFTEEMFNKKLLPNTATVRESVVLEGQLNDKKITFEISYSYEENSLLENQVNNISTNQSENINTTQEKPKVEKEEESKDKVVKFEDEGLKKFILDNLHAYNGEDKEAGIPGEYDFKLVDSSYRKSKDETEIYIKDMEQIEAIGIRGYYDFEAYSNAESEEEIEKLKLEVKDLSALQYAKNLKMLSVSSHDVEQSFSPNGLKDISILKNLQNLELLRLSHNAISDISVLSNMPNLKKLYLSHNLIENISPVANLTNLTALDFSRNNVKDISSIANLTGLTELTIVDTKISTIEPIKNMTKLERLDIRENNISDISILSKFTNLTDVLFDKNQIADFRTLGNLTNLVYVSSGGQKITVSEEVSVNSKTFEIDSLFKGFENLVQDQITVESNIPGVNITFNKETNKLLFELTDEFVAQNNNSTVQLELVVKATNKYEFLFSYEDFEYYLNNVQLKLNIQN